MVGSLAMSEIAGAPVERLLAKFGCHCDCIVAIRGKLLKRRGKV